MTSGPLEGNCFKGQSDECSVMCIFCGMSEYCYVAKTPSELTKKEDAASLWSYIKAHAPQTHPKHNSHIAEVKLERRVVRFESSSSSHYQILGPAMNRGGEAKTWLTGP